MCKSICDSNSILPVQNAWLYIDGAYLTCKLKTLVFNFESLLTIVLSPPPKLLWQLYILRQDKITDIFKNVADEYVCVVLSFRLYVCLLTLS